MELIIKREEFNGMSPSQHYTGLTINREVEIMKRIVIITISLVMVLFSYAAICKAGFNRPEGIATELEVNREDRTLTPPPESRLLPPSKTDLLQGRHPCQLTNECDVDLELRYDHADGVDACGPESIHDDILERRPGLAGFYLATNFRDDMPLERIMARAVNHDEIEVEFSDTMGTTACRNYNWRIKRLELPRETIFPSMPVEGFVEDTDGVIVPLYEAPSHVPVLTGFWIARDSEHKLKRIKVRVYKEGTTSYLHIVCEDKDPDGDYFYYLVYYALVPIDFPYEVVQGWARGTVSTDWYQHMNINLQNPVLQGFDLEFLNDDSDVSDIGVVVRPGSCSVFLDASLRPDFDWTIWYVDIDDTYNLLD